MPAKRSAVVPWPMTFGWRSGAIRKLRQADHGRAARLDGAAAIQWKDTEVPAVEITGLPPNIDLEFNLMELIHANHA